MKKVSTVAWGLLGLSGVFGGACKSSEDDDGMGGMGGETTSGGSEAAGGRGNGTGGRAEGSGGRASSGGRSSGGGNSGGSDTGGQSPAGGAPAGGNSSGGMGGVPSTGGMGDGTGGLVVGSGGTEPGTACADFPESPAGNLGGAGSMGGASSEDFVLASTSFDYCDEIPPDHTCDNKPFGSGTLPPLEWTEGPAGTMSYAVVFKDLSLLDQNVPGTFQYNRAYHWVIWDIPADTLSLPEGLPGSHFPPEVDGARQWGARNNYGYLGSCPNPDPALNIELEDSYSYTLYALPDAIVDVPAKTEINNWTRTMAEYLDTIAIAKTELRGTSNARASEGPPALTTLVYPCPTVGEGTPDCVARQN